MIFIIDDDEIMADCIARACTPNETTVSINPNSPNETTVSISPNSPNETTVSFPVKIFSNAYTAMDAISDGTLPDLIFLDILLDGPDGFTLLHELASYTDTAQIPVVIVSSLDFKNRDLSVYGVVGVLSKDSMKPQDIQDYVKTYLS